MDSKKTERLKMPGKRQNTDKGERTRNKKALYEV
jgi:hypothetical protein